MEIQIFLSVLRNKAWKEEVGRGKQGKSIHETV